MTASAGRYTRLILASLGLAWAAGDATSEPSGGPGAPAGSAVIIVNAGWPAGTISKADIEGIFLGKKTRLDDLSVVFVVQKEGDVHEAFLRNYLGKTAMQFRNYWRQMVFTGKGGAPKAFESEADLARYVAGTAGAIGYVSAGAAATLDKVKKPAVQ